MNNLTIMGRLTRDPEVRYGGKDNTAIATFDVAVDRRFKRDGQPTADFFRCVAFGKLGEFVEKYLNKGKKIVLMGEVQNNNYKDKNGNMQYSFKVIANSIEFAESKKAQEENGTAQSQPSNDDDFMSISQSEVDKLPFN